MKQLLLAILALALTACTTVEPGHTGVVTDWGETQTWTYGEGFHGTQWFGLDVYEMSTQVQALDFVGEDHITVLSRDRLQMGMDLSIQYQLDEGSAPRIFQELYNRSEGEERYTSRVIEPAAREAIRNVVSHMDALAAVQERDHLGPAIHQGVARSVANLLEAAGVPRYAVRIVGVQVRNIQLPERLTESIAAIQQAENQAMQRQQEIAVAAQEAERVRIEAEGQRAVAIIQANRDAEARLLRARADAEANTLLSRSLTTSVLEARRIDAQRAILSSSGTRTFVLSGGGNGATPLLDMRTVAGATR